ncbi:MAG: hypothetical protein ABR511_00775 [Acidimicrobiales bacterium]
MSGRRLAFLAAVVAILSGAAACSHGGGGAARVGPTSTTAAGPLAFTVSGTDVQSVPSPAPPFPDDVKAAVVDVLDRYLSQAVAGPLTTGRPAADLGALFTAPALARVNGPDRGAMVDEGLPTAPGLVLSAASARLVALVPSGTSLTAVAAAIDLRVQTRGSDPVTVARTGHLVLVPNGSTWKIDGYDLHVTRDSDGGSVTTEAHK